MSSRNTLLDPVAALAALILGIGAFVLIPGAVVALLAAVASAVLGYAVVLGLRALAGGRSRTPQPAVGAASESAAAPRLPRGSAAEVWLQRGRKALEGMRRMVADSTQPIIAGQLENVVIEAADAISVLEELAARSALVHSSLNRLSPAQLRDQRASLRAAIDDPGATAAMLADRRRALESVDEQEATLHRLLDVQTGLTTRMESIVVGLERLSAQIGETLATATATVATTSLGGEQHLRDLGERLEGLRAGLEESRRFTAQILGPQAD